MSKLVQTFLFRPTCDISTYSNFVLSFSHRLQSVQTNSDTVVHIFKNKIVLIKEYIIFVADIVCGAILLVTWINIVPHDRQFYTTWENCLSWKAILSCQAITNCSIFVKWCNLSLFHITKLLHKFTICAVFLWFTLFSKQCFDAILVLLQFTQFWVEQKWMQHSCLWRNMMCGSKSNGCVCLSVEPWIQLARYSKRIQSIYSLYIDYISIYRCHCNLKQQF